MCVCVCVCCAFVGLDNKTFSIIIVLLTPSSLRSWNRIPVGDDIFRTRPDRPWGPFILPYNGYRISFPGESGGGEVLTTQPHLALRLKKE